MSDYTEEAARVARQRIMKQRLDWWREWEHCQREIWQEEIPHVEEDDGRRLRERLSALWNRMFPVGHPIRGDV